MQINNIEMYFTVEVGRIRLIKTARPIDEHSGMTMIKFTNYYYHMYTYISGRLECLENTPVSFN